MSLLDEILTALGKIPDWGLCPWWHFGWSAHVLRELCLKSCYNLMSLKISRTCSCCWSQSGLWTFLTWAGVLDDIWGSLHIHWLKFSEICSVWWMTLLELLLDSMLIMDIPDWGWCPWWRFEWSPYAPRKQCLQFGWNLFSLKASRSPSKIDDIAAVFAGDYEDYGHSRLGLVSMMTFWMVCICSE